MVQQCSDNVVILFGMFYCINGLNGNQWFSISSKLKLKTISKE